MVFVSTGNDCKMVEKWAFSNKKGRRKTPPATKLSQNTRKKEVLK